MTSAGDWAAEIEGGDVVDSAPELARLTLNVAMAHHDATSTGDGRRLVYGGHTIGLAAAQATRALPTLVTILGWHACDHTAPVFEGDTLRSRARARAPRAAARGRRAAAPALARHRGARRRRGGGRRARLALRGGAGMSRAAARRPARDRGLGVRRRAARRHDARPARRRRDPLRPDRRRPRLQPLAARAVGPSAVLGRAEQGQALDPGRPALARGARARRRADRRRPGPAAASS